MLRPVASLVFPVARALARRGTSVVLVASVATIALAGCDKPAQGSQPAGAGAAPNTGEAPSPSGEPEATSGSEGEGTVAAGVGGKADGAACSSPAECASGVCEGEGCGDDQPGTCAPSSRMCTRDLREYCGCDGVTFRASGSCPGARFSKREAC